ncbi:ribosomal protein S9 [Marinithermus hydrothermalis DSM 14884]|uniref:Small ribosomal subunit protein uS9 n=1 Tax=Marinithermus hydrothermalis (strain DSM 14884 / JCM 11576 / T1) TaxID=869210 RepID=F2NM51_MARHT|nr:30S ribosomal protein S9 [Marinithermus hydrothermalis]AEB11521.1 ribosomal protein S9 [Marinithermus hydrothermalis DSM 14884]
MALEQYYGTGRRKTAVARVFLRPGDGKITVNKQDFQDYFRGIIKAVSALEPLRVTGLMGRFDLYITVKGGGKSGQIDAIKLGLARALLQYDADLRAKLKPAGLLTRDAREVERKKYGKHKARRAPQYSKR